MTYQQWLLEYGSMLDLAEGATWEENYAVWYNYIGSNPGGPPPPPPGA